MDATGILIFSEDQDLVLELLTVALSLRGDANDPIFVAAIGEAPQAMAETSLAHGADEILVVKTAAEIESDAGQMAAILHEVVEKVRPATILVGATRLGADTVARLAQKLKAPCASDCMTLKRIADGEIEITRRVYGGRFVALQVLEGSPRIASIPPNRFAKANPVQAPKASIKEVPITSSPPRVRILGAAQRVRSAVDVTKAEVIVAAGRGVKKREDLALLNGLADTLGGVLAGSRPLTGDVDWLPVDSRIGLSGQTVKPNLYVACGISGQIEHIVGMKDSRTVVAINSDAKAPIHAEADYSVVGDLYEFVPAFMEACARARQS